MDFMLVIAGDDFAMDCEFTEDDGTPVNLTGCIVFFTCKQQPQDTDDEALFKGQQDTHSDAVNGKTTIAIPRAEMQDLPPGDWYGDVQIRDAAGLVSTPSGIFQVRVQTGITQRVA